MYSIFMGHSIGHKGKIYENLCLEQQRMVHSTNKNGELNNNTCRDQQKEDLSVWTKSQPNNISYYINIETLNNGDLLNHPNDSKCIQTDHGFTMFHMGSWHKLTIKNALFTTKNRDLISYILWHLKISHQTWVSCYTTFSVASHADLQESIPKQYA